MYHGIATLIMISLSLPPSHCAIVKTTTIIPLTTLHSQTSEADTLRSRERRPAEHYSLAPAAHQSLPRWSRDVLATPQRASGPHTAPLQQWPLCHTSLRGKNKRRVINYLPFTQLSASNIKCSMAPVLQKFSHFCDNLG